MQYLVMEPLFCSSHPKEIHEQRVKFQLDSFPIPSWLCSLHSLHSLFCGHGCESTGCENLSWRCKAPCKRQSRKQVGGVRDLGACPPLPHEIFKIEHSETPFPAYLRQGSSSLKFSSRGKIVKKKRKEKNS